MLKHEDGTDKTWTRTTSLLQLCIACLTITAFFGGFFLNLYTANIKRDIHDTQTDTRLATLEALVTRDHDLMVQSAADTHRIVNWLDRAQGGMNDKRQ